MTQKENNKAYISFDAETGAPRCGRFGDIYFAPGEGRAEARYVFIQGAGIPELCRRQTSVRIFEAGFGTGLNIAETLSACAEAGFTGTLDVVSVEKYPPAPEEAQHALTAAGCANDAIALCRTALQQAARGNRDTRITLPTGKIICKLRVIIGDIADIASLAQDEAPFDAIYLDGFAPACNPEMWRDALFAFLAEKSLPEKTRCATFTAAGAVKRGLQRHGFTVEKTPGYGRKRHMLTALYGAR